MSDTTEFLYSILGYIPPPLVILAVLAACAFLGSDWGERR